MPSSAQADEPVAASKAIAAAPAKNFEPTMHSPENVPVIRPKPVDGAVYATGSGLSQRER
jgi:hypothetical protein